MYNQFDFELLKNKIKKEINKNVLSGNNSFELLLDGYKINEKKLRKIKKCLKDFQIIAQSTRIGNDTILYINFNDSPVINLLRSVYGVK